MTKKLIVTADDYGMCESVNEAIEACLASNAVQATCVMTNMPFSKAAESLRKNFLNVSLGIHWNLTQGRPLLSPSRIPTLVRSDGEFHSELDLRRRWLTGGVKLAEIQAELRAQFQRFYELAGAPDFWNTHQNVHLLPRLFDACVSLGKDLGVRAMRCHRRITVPRGTTALRYHFAHPQYWLKGKIVSRWSARAEAKEMRMPDGRIHMPGYAATVTSIDEALSRIAWETVRRAAELVIHPANRLNGELFGDLKEARLTDFKTFTHPALIEALRRQRIETVGFEVL